MRLDEDKTWALLNLKPVIYGCLIRLDLKFSRITGRRWEKQTWTLFKAGTTVAWNRRPKAAPKPKNDGEKTRTLTWLPIRKWNEEIIQNKFSCQMGDYEAQIKATDYKSNSRKSLCEAREREWCDVEVADTRDRLRYESAR